MPDTYSFDYEGHEITVEHNAIHSRGLGGWYSVYVDGNHETDVRINPHRWQAMSSRQADLAHDVIISHLTDAGWRLNPEYDEPGFIEHTDRMAEAY